MKRFDELTNEEFKRIVLRSQELCQALDLHIQEVEMDFISDKLKHFSRMVARWSIGFFDKNYFEPNISSCSDPYDYVSCIENCIKDFGCSERLKKLLEQCKKLYDTNLYMHFVKKLYHLYFKEELQSIVNFVENISCELHSGKISDDCFFYLESFQTLYAEYLYDESSGIYYKPFKPNAKA